MSSITLDVPDELALQLQPMEAHLPRILELGLRELNAAGQTGFDGAAEGLEFLATLPIPQEVLNLRPSATLQARLSTLLEKSHEVGLTVAEEQQWQQYEYLEHLVRAAKGKAYLKLRN